MAIIPKITIKSVIAGAIMTAIAIAIIWRIPKAKAIITGE